METLQNAIKSHYTQKKGTETERVKTRVDELREITLAAYKVLDGIAAEEKELAEKYRAEKVTGKVKDETQSKLNARLRELKADLRTKLNDLQNIYNIEVDAWAALDGSKLTDDVKLLSGAVTLTGDELTALSTKHRDNATMQRALREYASKNNLAFDAAAPLPAQKKEAFNNLVQAALKSTDDGLLHRAYIEMDDKFNELAGSVLHDHGEYVPPQDDSGENDV